MPCPVCYGCDGIPKRLSCKHTVCLVCLQRMIETYEETGSQVKCPVCRAITSVPGGQATNLTTNLLQEKLWTRTSLQVDSVECYFCDDNEDGKEMQYCRDCCKNICQQCATEHRKTEIFTCHRIYATHTMYCEHNNKCEHYCVQCDDFVCSRCVQRGNCREHSGFVFKIESLKSEKLEKVKNFLTELNDEIQLSDDVKESRLMKIKDIFKMVKDVKSALNKHLTQLLFKIRSKAKDVMAEIENWEKSFVDEKKRMDWSLTHKSLLQELHNSTEESLDHGTECAILIDLLMKEYIPDLLYSNPITSLDGFIMFEPEDNITVGRTISSQIICRNRPSQKSDKAGLINEVYENCGQKAANFKETVEHEYATIGEIPTLMSQVSGKGYQSGDTKYPFTRSTKLDNSVPNETITTREIVAKNTDILPQKQEEIGAGHGAWQQLQQSKTEKKEGKINWRFYDVECDGAGELHATKTKWIGKWAKAGLKRANDVIFTPYGNIVVCESDSHDILLFDSTGSLITSSKNREVTFVSKPWSITYDQYEAAVLVSDSGGHLTWLDDKRLTFKYKVTLKGNSGGAFGVAVLSNGNLVVGRGGSQHTIGLYDKYGSELKKITHYGSSKNEPVSHPWYITVLPDNIIVVTLYTCNCVVYLSENLECLRSVPAKCTKGCAIAHNTGIFIVSRDKQDKICQITGSMKDRMHSKVVMEFANPAKNGMVQSVAVQKPHMAVVLDKSIQLYTLSNS